jgi:hypothetical protein
MPLPGRMIDDFDVEFPTINHQTAIMRDRRVLLFDKPLRDYVDLYSSSPTRLVLLDQSTQRAEIQVTADTITCGGGVPASLPVKVRNISPEAFPSGKGIFGLSYHLASRSGQVLAHDNPRVWITTPILPGEQRDIPLEVCAPGEPGDYLIDIDLVWEGVMWFREFGSLPATVKLTVR